MDPFNGIIIQVISNDNALRFYNGPETAENEDVYTRQRYIEAVTGATFWVKIMLTNEFDTGPLDNEDGVQVLINFDGLDPSWHQHLTKYELERGSRQGLPRIFEFKDISHFSPETGTWMRSAYTFGSLQMSKLVYSAGLTDE